VCVTIPDTGVPEIELSHHPIVLRLCDGKIDGRRTIRIFRHEISDSDRVVVLDGGRDGDHQ